jgi:hypothetical protein
MQSFLDKWQSCKLVLSHPSGLLAGLMDEFADARVARQSASTRRVLAQHESILGQVDDICRMRALARGPVDSNSRTVNGEPLATHLLYGDLALPLTRPISIQLDETGPRMSGELDEKAALTIVMRNRSLETLHRSKDASLPASCRPGEAIRIGEHELKLILVHDD